MPETHPIQEHPELPVERRLQLLEIYLAQLWDQVWWLSLPVKDREMYQSQGFTDPIDKFYSETG